MYLRCSLSTPAADHDQTCPCPDRSTVAPQSATESRPMQRCGDTYKVGCYNERGRRLFGGKLITRTCHVSPCARSVPLYGLRVRTWSIESMAGEQTYLCHGCGSPHVPPCRTASRETPPARARPSTKAWRASTPPLYVRKSLVQARNVNARQKRLTRRKGKFGVVTELRDAEWPHCKDGGGKKCAQPYLTGEITELTACVRSWPLQPKLSVEAHPTTRSPHCSNLTTNLALTKTAHLSIHDCMCGFRSASR